MIVAPTNIFSNKQGRSCPFDHEEYPENLSLSTTKRLRTSVEDHMNISISHQLKDFPYPYSSSLGSTEESAEDAEFWNLESISYCPSPCESEVETINKTKFSPESKNFSYSVSNFNETSGAITIKLVRQKLSDCPENVPEEEDSYYEEDDYDSEEEFYQEGDSQYEEEEEELDFDEPFVFADDKYLIAHNKTTEHEESNNEEYNSSSEL